jgi:hypothetical protein
MLGLECRQRSTIIVHHGFCRVQIDTGEMLRCVLRPCVVRSVVATCVWYACLWNIYQYRCCRYRMRMRAAAPMHSV